MTDYRPVVVWSQDKRFPNSAKDGYMFIGECGGKGDCQFYSIAAALSSAGVYMMAPDGPEIHDYNMMILRGMAASNITTDNI